MSLSLISIITINVVSIFFATIFKKNKRLLIQASYMGLFLLLSTSGTLDILGMSNFWSGSIVEGGAFQVFLMSFPTLLFIISPYMSVSANGFRVKKSLFDIKELLLINSYLMYLFVNTVFIKVLMLSLILSFYCFYFIEFKSEKSTSKIHHAILTAFIFSFFSYAVGLEYGPSSAAVFLGLSFLGYLYVVLKIMQDEAFESVCLPHYVLLSFLLIDYVNLLKEDSNSNIAFSKIGTTILIIFFLKTVFQYLAKRNPLRALLEIFVYILSLSIFVTDETQATIFVLDLVQFSIVFLMGVWVWSLNNFYEKEEISEETRLYRVVQVASALLTIVLPFSFFNKTMNSLSSLYEVTPMVVTIVIVINILFNVFFVELFFKNKTDDISIIFIMKKEVKVFLYIFLIFSLIVFLYTIESWPTFNTGYKSISRQDLGVFVLPSVVISTAMVIYIYSSKYYYKGIQNWGLRLINKWETLTLLVRVMGNGEVLKTSGERYRTETSLLGRFVYSQISNKKYSHEQICMTSFVVLAIIVMIGLIYGH